MKFSFTYSILVSFFTISFLSGCGGGDSDKPDTSPNIPSTITPQENSQAGTEVIQRFTVSGINQDVNISISGGEYAIGNGEFTSESGTVGAGQSVSVRLLSSTTFGESNSAMVTVGDQTVTVTVTTEDEDLEPDSVDLQAQTDLNPGAELESETFTISGINTTAPVSVSRGEYSIDGGEFTSNAGSIDSGQEIQIRALASSEWEGVVDVELTVGTSVFQWSLTTMQENVIPEARILFPLPNSSTSRDTIVVRGVATDNTDISRVVVNGIEAELENRSNLPEGVSVEWSASIETSVPEITVDVLDTKDNLAEEAATLNFDKEYYLPTHIAYVEEDEVIWGSSGWSVEWIDLAAGVKESVFVDLIGQGCFSPSLGEYFFLRVSDPEAADNQWRGETEVGLNIFSLNPETQLVRSWGGFTSPAPEGDSVVFHSIMKLECDEANNAVIAVTNFGKWESDYLGQITQLTLGDTPEINVLLTAGDEGYEDWTVDLSSVDDGILTTINHVNFGELSTFNSSDLSQINTTQLPYSIARGLAVDQSRGVSYLAYQDGIYSYPHDGGDSSEVSIVEADDPFYFGTIGSFILGSEGNLFTRDITLDAVIKIDPNTGERSEYLRPASTGSGDKIIFGDEIAANQAGTLIYVLDSGRSNRVQLIEVDVQSANRRLITSLDITGVIYDSGLALNEADGVLYAAFNDVLFEINIESGNSIEIASPVSGTGIVLESIEAVEYVAEINSLYIADPELAAVLVINLEDGNRNLVSHSSLGDGPPLDGVDGIAMVDGDMYVSVGGTNSVYSIDLATGNRDAISLVSCIDSSGNIRDFTNSRSYGIRYSPAADLLVLPGFSTRAVDLETEECLMLTGSSFGDVVPTENEEFYFTLGRNSIGYWDAVTKEVVTISK